MSRRGLFTAFRELLKDIRSLGNTELDAIKQEAKLLQKQLDEVRFMMHEAGVPCNCSSMSGRSERLECCACLICPLHVQLEQVRALRIKQQDEAILRDVRKAVTAMEEVADSVDARRAQVEQLLGEAASGAQLEYVRKLHQKAQSISQAAVQKIMDPSMSPAELEAAALQLAKQLRGAQAVEDAQAAGAPLQTGSQQDQEKPP
eukprot:jgi/Astpho2/9888/Aster-06602